MQAHLGLHRVPIGGERLPFDHDPVAVRVRTVEADQHQVQVDGQGVHGHHLVGPRPRQLGEGLPQFLVVRHPRMAGLEMTLDGQFPPGGHFLLQGGRHAFRLQAQRVAAEIHLRAAVVAGRQPELVAKCAQRVLGIEALDFRRPGRHADASTSGYSMGRLGVASERRGDNSRCSQ